MDPAVFTLLDEVADARHFVIRAHGADSAFGDLGAPSFTGRSDELRKLASWLAAVGPRYMWSPADRGSANPL
ncbi:hypothetical protein [Streptomyces sp. AS02]|uniref:hypothetical protein n=1 Tax=Streptomyces sp. AS02 TaxID=2938946 RepID=UPI002021465D|nr:hypothetical protein [Streptomyces sp. AS02]MCL8014158.1 hypothetical protein [Streptomyces sp. AS02]